MGMGDDPLVYQLFSEAQRLAHVGPSIGLWFYPQREIDDRPFPTLKKAFTPLYAQRMGSEETDRDEIFPSQCPTKKGPNGVAIANHCHIKVIADPFRLRTSQDQVAEQPIEGIRHALGLAVGVFPMAESSVHGSRLIEKEDEAARLSATDLG